MANIKLLYGYNTLDERHEFCLENSQSIFCQWVWFFLGRELGEEKINLLPYIFAYMEHTINMENLLESSETGSAEKIAIRIARKIKWKLKKINKKTKRCRWR